MGCPSFETGLIHQQIRAARHAELPHDPTLKHANGQAHPWACDIDDDVLIRDDLIAVAFAQVGARNFFSQHE